jgi:bacterioferritin
MKSDPQVIVHLNAQLKNELTATNQYFLHYRMLKHWGFERLAKKEYEESIGEMKHADRLMERIFMLDGLPNLQDLGKLLIGENVPELLSCDLQSESGAQATIKGAIAYCESVATSSRARSCKTSSTTPRSTSTGSRPRSSCSPRSGSRTTCKRRWAPPTDARHEDRKPLP